VIPSRHMTHMKSTHASQDMPYSCQLCLYRSSVYNDVVAHFRKVACLSCHRLHLANVAHCVTSLIDLLTKETVMKAVYQCLYVVCASVIKAASHLCASTACI